MLSINIKVNDIKTQLLLNRLGKDAPKVLADSQNRAVTGIRTDGTRLIRKASGIERKKIFDSFRIIKASATDSSPCAKVIVSGQPIGLYQFAHKPKKIMGGKTKNGVRINIAGKEVQFRHAFIAKMSSGHTGIFERIRGEKTRTGKEKMREFFGPSIPQIAGRQNIENQISQQAQERFRKRFNQQVDRYLKKKGGK